MSKYVKNLVAAEVRKRLTGVEDALLVNVIGLPTDKTYALRKKLRERNISLLVVKGSLAKRATEGTSLAPAFEGSNGSLAVCWGSTDFVQLAKEITEIQQDAQYEKFELRGGVMDREKLSADRVKDISKWPSRLEQLSILMGQVLCPGANLLSQLASPGGALASQIKQKGEETEASS
ncbi:MAG: 50S ribosomal protein L10 [Planctomycetes bacterium]|nr:50S ribosomal protein L10 [Planctomycetota bacterium]